MGPAETQWDRRIGWRAGAVWPPGGHFYFALTGRVDFARNSQCRRDATVGSYGTSCCGTSPDPRRRTSMACPIAAAVVCRLVWP